MTDREEIRRIFEKSADSNRWFTKVITCGWYKRYTYEFTFYLRNNVRRHDRMVRHRDIRRCRYSRAVRPEQWRRSEYNASHGDHVGRAWMCLRLRWHKDEKAETSETDDKREGRRRKNEKEGEGRIGKRRWNKRNKAEGSARMIYVHEQ